MPQSLKQTPKRRTKGTRSTPEDIPRRQNGAKKGPKRAAGAKKGLQKSHELDNGRPPETSKNRGGFGGGH